MSKPHKYRTYPSERVPIAAPSKKKALPKSTSVLRKEVKPPKVIPVQVINTVLQNLPNPDLQQFGVTREIPYDPNNWTDSLQVRDYTILTVPNGVNYVITDAVFYALRAGIDPAAPLIALEDYQLAGAFTFDLIFSGVARMQLETDPVEINATGPVPLQMPRMSGWSTLNQNFGATRTAPFALYGEEAQEISARITLTHNTQIPQFALTKFGISLSGLTVSTTAFDKIWTTHNMQG